jgi:uncharacterized protein (AIM24 family)
VALQASIGFDVQAVPGIKNWLFGGEGLFLSRLTGPGRVILQTMPLSRLAESLQAQMGPTGGRKGGQTTLTFG